MANFSFISILSKVWDVISAIGKGIMCLIAVIFVFIIYAISYLFCYNWLLFPIWALILPKQMAKAMKNENGDESFWYYFFNTITPMVSWEARLLPWYAKKYFISAMPEIFSAPTLVRYYRKAANKEEAAKLMNPDAKLYAWYKLNDVERAEFLPFISGWNEDMLEYAIEENMLDEIKKYYETNTPSEKHYPLLVSYAEKRGAIMKILVSCIKKHGLKQDLIDDIFANGSGDLKNQVSKALEVYAQVTFIKEHQSFGETNAKAWNQFCANTKDICTEAQEAMFPWMTDDFYRENHCMSEEAICLFLKNACSSEKEKMAMIAMANQPEDCRKSERAMALINSRQNLKEFFVKIPLTSN